MTPEQTISELARLAAAYGQKLEPEQAAAYVQHLGTLAGRLGGPQFGVELARQAFDIPMPSATQQVHALPDARPRRRPGVAFGERQRARLGGGRHGAVGALAAGRARQTQQLDQPRMFGAGGQERVVAGRCGRRSRAGHGRTQRLDRRAGAPWGARSSCGTRVAIG